MDDGPLVEALTSSQRLGMLGARRIADVIDHAEAFVDAIVDVAGLVVDLGSGGGVPGLVIAWRRSDLDVVLVDRRATRTDHLNRLVGRLSLGDRVTVWCGDADALDLDPPARAVVARGFGPPLRTAAVAAPLLSPGGRLVVSDPPASAGTGDRWPREELATLGLAQLDHPDRRVAVFRRFT